MVGEGWIGSLDVSRCKPLYAERIDKVLLYSTGNYSQYPVVSHNGK